MPLNTVSSVFHFVVKWHQIKIENIASLYAEEINLVTFGVQKRIKLDSESDTAKIVTLFKNQPNLSIEEARARARIWIDEGKMTMKKGSVHNVVNQAYEHFIKGDILNLNDKILRALSKLSNEERQKLTAVDLKKDPEFSKYNLDTLDTYLRKHRI
ncbi:MAG: hypothetical protein JW776_01410 [Candidatus Lokiarchaeota archaeon]|nr:hypothetical protein [Candidatus Lokiarchaeota archaeon]